jgi:hypothetical protein
MVDALPTQCHAQQRSVVFFLFFQLVLFFKVDDDLPFLPWETPRPLAGRSRGLLSRQLLLWWTNAAVLRRRNLASSISSCDYASCGHSHRGLHQQRLPV